MILVIVIKCKKLCNSGSSFWLPTDMILRTTCHFVEFSLFWVHISFTSPEMTFLSHSSSSGVVVISCRVTEHCIKKRLQWNTCFVRKVCKEGEYYEEMMRYLRKNLAVRVIWKVFKRPILYEKSAGSSKKFNFASNIFICFKVTKILCWRFISKAHWL